MECTTLIPGEREGMPEKHRMMYEEFRKIKSQNRRAIHKLYESRKAEFDAMAEVCGGPAPDIKVGTAADLSGVDPDNIINITLDFSEENVEKMKAQGYLKKAREWTAEDASMYNPLCRCGCGRRGPLPAPGEVVPEDWRPSDDDYVFRCTDAVVPNNEITQLEHRHAGHQIQNSQQSDLDCAGTSTPNDHSS